MEEAKKPQGLRGVPAAPAATPAPMEAARSRRTLAANVAAGVTADMAAEPMDAGKSVQSIASAAKVGELFQYTVGNVSLPRQKSAMIPIVTDEIEIERLSIYNQSVLPRTRSTAPASRTPPASTCWEDPLRCSMRTRTRAMRRSTRCRRGRNG
jgi:hypothetical protein